MRMARGAAAATTAGAAVAPADVGICESDVTEFPHELQKRLSGGTSAKHVGHCLDDEGIGSGRLQEMWRPNKRDLNLHRLCKLANRDRGRDNPAPEIHILGEFGTRLHGETTN
jgi:hypothetical protein